MANPSGGMRLKVMSLWRGIPTPRYYPEEREPWPLNRLERGHRFTEEWGAVQRHSHNKNYSSIWLGIELIVLNFDLLNLGS